MSHPLGYPPSMTKRIQAKPVVSPVEIPVFPSSARKAPSTRRTASGAPPSSTESGLLRLCEEVAGRLLRRYLEIQDPVRAVREMRLELVALLACDQERAGQIVDLALELVHVKTHGSFKRNPLELSQLIARAGKQLRNLADN